MHILNSSNYRSIELGISKSPLAYSIEWSNAHWVITDSVNFNSTSLIELYTKLLLDIIQFNHASV